LFPKRLRAVKNTEGRRIQTTRRIRKGSRNVGKEEREKLRNTRIVENHARCARR
jgi:hypothetical protein